MCPVLGGTTTKSFWEGVDSREALSLVIIDKLPFAPHRDTVIQHREQRIREAGGNPSMQFLLPEAILALKQGVGRLIRAEADRGVMADSTRASTPSVTPYR
jgi:ATP-dependent DNA helicase DinG